MLGHFTERATSRGRSRSFSRHGARSVSSNESEQRRALLLPQEFKELGSERLVLILENCKPILADKIRYHRERAFTERLRPPPEVPRMDMDLHLARVQQRWRAVEEIPADQALRIEALAHDLSQLPESFDGTPAQTAEMLLAFFAGSEAAAGGHLEPLPDDDGVLAEPITAEAAAPEPDTEPHP